jgi:methyltransferase (TIGR00027 family)
VGGLLVILAVNVVLAVEPGQPSKTSIMAAARRALAAHEYDPTVRNPDWMAEHFLGPLERKIIGNDPSILALDMDYREGQNVQANSVGIMLTRTRFIDDRLRYAVTSRQARQVVILGAGFDSRAYRMRQLLKGVKVFEVDYGPTHVYKKQRVEEILGSLPKNVRYVPIDFTREKLSEELAQAGFRTNQASFFVWEGTSFYLPEEAVRDTLRYVSTTAPGSAIVFDSKRQSFINWVKANLDAPERVSPEMRPVLEQQRKFAYEWKEPWLFGLPDGREAEFLRSVGLEMSELLEQDGDEAQRRYQTRRDGSIAFPVTRNRPGAPAQAGHMVEASVPGSPTASK